MAARDMELDDDEIRQPDTWEVIRKYFDENGLCQQQRASYNEFILQNVQVGENWFLLVIKSPYHRVSKHGVCVC
jgi:hypothetical protein